MGVNKKYAEYYGDEEEEGEEEKEPMMKEDGEDKPDEMAGEWNQNNSCRIVNKLTSLFKRVKQVRF